MLLVSYEEIDFSLISDQEIYLVEFKLNNLPCICLGVLTHLEIYENCP
jgi:hypothetical protein